MDWAKVGEGIESGAHTLAAGLMEKYQRQKEMEDWYQKQTALDKLQRAEETRKQKFEVGKLDYEMTLAAAKKDFETNPELIPYWQRAQTGDEEAQRVIKVYTGAKHMMDSRTPLSSEEISELSALPPQTRHTIINRHLTTLDAEIKRQADLKRTEAETKYREAMAKKAEAELAAGPGDKYHAEGVAAVKGREQDIKDRIAARDKKREAVQQLETNLMTLHGLIGDKERELAVTKGGKDAKAGVTKEIESLQMKVQQADDQKKRLEDDLQREANMLRKQRPDLFEPDTPAQPQEELAPELMDYMSNLPPAERAEIMKAIKARPDLPQSVIIQKHYELKQKKEAAMRATTPSAAAMRVR